ncbi:MAG: sigma-70 family RNA polymerase sigma factor [Saprospiraceae bacterium]|nr:sigma-70 family RNA polymerase sigma factor [Saprospiraceae bacterium]
MSGRSERRILGLLQTDPDTGITELYKYLRDAFLSFSRKQGYPEEIAQEAYHDAILGFYNLYRTGQYSGERASVKTLVFAIGKNQALQKMRKERKHMQTDELDDRYVNLWQDQAKEQVADDDSEQLAYALGLLPESCRGILTLFYYHRFSIEAIRHRLGHANDNVTKSHKSRCLRKLKELFTSMNVRT